MYAVVLSKKNKKINCYSNAISIRIERKMITHTTKGPSKNGIKRCTTMNSYMDHDINQCNENTQRVSLTLTQRAFMEHATVQMNDMCDNVGDNSVFALCAWG